MHAYTLQKRKKRMKRIRSKNMRAHEGRQNGLLRLGSRRYTQNLRATSIADQDYRPLAPPFKYFGGKSRTASKILRQIPEHKTWVEPFAGGASVTLAKPPSEREVLNDKRADVIKFYRHVKSGREIE